MKEIMVIGRPKLKIPTKFKIKCDFELVYFLLFFGYSFIYFINESLFSISSIMMLYKLFTIGVLGASFILRLNHKLLYIITSFIVLFAFTVASISTDRSYVLIYALFIINANRIQFKNVVKASLLGTAISVLLIVLCSKVGILHDYVFDHNGLKAHALGFSYYGTVPYSVLYCMTGYLYVKKNEASYLELILLQVFNYIVYTLTTTRLTFILFIIVTFFYIVVVKWKIPRNITKLGAVFSMLLFPIAFSVTFWAAKHYSLQSKAWKKIDDLLNNRIELSHTALSLYPAKLFGQYIEMHGNSSVRSMYRYFYIDSGFLYAILGYGILFTLVVLFMYSFLFWYSYKNEERVILVWLLAVLIFSIVNNTWISLPYNSILVFFPIALTNQLSSDKNKNKYKELLRKLQ